MRGSASDTAAPAARCRNCLRGSFMVMLHELGHLPRHNHIQQPSECLVLALPGSDAMSGLRRSLAHSETLCTWRRSCAEPGRSHPCPVIFAGPVGKARSRTSSMYVDEKSDEAIVLRKRPNKRRRLLAEVVEGRASPKGNSWQAAVVRTLRNYTVGNRRSAPMDRIRSRHMS
jgi:hypothetical protein